MATEKEKTPLFIKVGISLIVLILTVWAASAATTKISAAESFLLSSHETRIVKVERDIDDVRDNVSRFAISVDKRFDMTEKMQVALQKDQQAILYNQRDMKDQINTQTALQIEMITESAKLNAYLTQFEYEKDKNAKEESN